MMYLAPGSNVPTGGSAEDDLLPDLVGAVREAWPEDRPLCVHVPAWEDPEDDAVIDAGLRVARVLAARGCDLLAVDLPPRRARRERDRAHVAQLFTSDLVRNVVGVPTLIAEGLYSVGDVTAVILAGRADLCAWPRLAWPQWRPPGDSRVSRSP